MTYRILATGIGSSPVFPTGDYNRDLVVDGEDYDTWVASFGDIGVGLAADGNGNGRVDVADYTVWRDNEGASSISSTSQSTAITTSNNVLTTDSDLSAASAFVSATSRQQVSLRSRIRSIVADRNEISANERVLLYFASDARELEQRATEVSEENFVSSASRDAAFELADEEAWAEFAPGLRKAFR